jgi:hypothetical protein
MPRSGSIEPTRSGQRPQVYGTERVCDFPECRTVLSRYNPDPTCEPHKSANRQRFGERPPGKS